MAKRHHQSKRARAHERIGMEHHYGEHVTEAGRRNESEAMRHHSDRGGMIVDRHRGMEGHYSGMEARRHQEMQDAGMIHSDPHAIANLPQNVMIKMYPKTGPYLPEILDDTIRGIDHQMDYDDSQRRKNFYPKKV